MPKPMRLNKKAYIEFAVSVCVITFMVVALCLFPEADNSKGLPTQTSVAASETISHTDADITTAVSSIEKSKSVKHIKSTTTSKSAETGSRDTKATSTSTESKTVTSYDKSDLGQSEVSVNRFKPIDNFKKHMMGNMTSDQKIILNQILNGIENFETVINIKKNVLKRDDFETIKSLFVLVKIACIENSSVASTYRYVGNDDYISAFKLTYTKSKKQAMSEKRQLMKKTDSILKGITADMNEFEKIKYIHDTVTKNCVYGELKSGSHDSAYGCLVKGKANCEGYSKAFLLLCNKAGIDSMIVTGTAQGNDGESDSHMWNMVKLEGKWYHIDLTWDDPTLTPVDKSYIRYDFFNLTDSEILQTHTSEKNRFYVYPKANSYKGNYFVYNNYCAVDFDSAYDAMERAVTDAVLNGNKYASIKLNNSKTYSSVKKKLFKSKNGKTPVFRILKSVKEKTKASISEKKISKIFMEQTNVITIGLK